jgi:hypothetical protein
MQPTKEHRQTCGKKGTKTNMWQKGNKDKHVAKKESKHKHVCLSIFKSVGEGDIFYLVLSKKMCPNQSDSAK